MVPPAGFVARKEGYDNLSFTVKSKYSTWQLFFLIWIHIPLEPIEQNVTGSKGIHELVYFLKESKSLERFKKSAQEFDKYLTGKSHDEIEKLVSLLFYNSNIRHSLYTYNLF